MSLAEERTPAIGDNSGDPHAIAWADIEARIAAFLQGAETWEKRKPEEIDDDLAARANDFLAGARKLWKDADKARDAEKRPHDDRAKEVQAKWKPVLTKIEKLGDIVKPLIAAHLKREEDRKREERQRAEAAAKKAEDEARRAREDAAKAASVTARLEAEERAEAQEAVAAHAQQTAVQAAEPARAASATGLANQRSLRTVRTPRITSLPAALAHYREEPELTELMLKLAARDLRQAPTISGEKQIPTIPGIAWDTEQKV